MQHDWQLQTDLLIEASLQHSRNYIISVTHPSVNYNFDLCCNCRNTPALVPVNTTATSKEYVLAANVKLLHRHQHNTLSFTCYQLSVTTPTTFAETGKNGLNEKGVAAKQYR
ncbi:MAG: hypothetical protein R2765_06475 [Ferruginibacter sp.]